MMRPIAGQRVTEILVTLSASDLRGRYGRGPWRLLKWLVDPFALVGVYLILVSALLDEHGRATGLSLACAVVPFQFLMMSVINAMDSVRMRAPIITNMAFPRTLIPLASVVTEAAAFAASLLLLAIMMAAYGVAPTAAALWLPAIVGVNLVLAVAIAYPATLLAVWVRDMRSFLVSVVRTLFFLAPGLVALDQISGDGADLVRLNPLTGLFEAYRDALLYGHSPEAWKLLWPLAVAALVAAIFVPIFRREQAQLAKVA
jgi:lipopolysaccharide transport system permease protein